MLRCLSFCAVVVILACPPSAHAQSTKPPSFTQRIKSLFTRNEKPKATPAPRSMKPGSKLSKKQPEKPVQVTTRSGALRQPGPGTPVPLEAQPTPTFAPDNRPLAGQPPRTMENPTARRIPTSTQKSPRRDSAVTQAAYQEVQPEKPTMFGWFRGLWGRKKKAKPVAPASHETMKQNTARPQGSSSSIDPRRVYRSPQPKPDQNRAGSGRSTDFSETGVPSSTSEFRGRRDSSF